MKKAVSELVRKIEDTYGDKQFEVLSINKNDPLIGGITFTVVVREIPVEEDK